MSDFNFFKDKLMLNGYPENLIYRTWTKINTNETAAEGPRGWVKLPFISNRNVTKVVTSIFRDADLGTVFSSGTKLKSMVPSLYRRKLVTEERNVVYQVPFLPPCDAVYTGQTLRPLAIRLSEHEGAIRRQETNRSSIAEYCVRTGFSPDFGNTKIIARSQTKRGRSIKESIARYIKYQRDISKINPILLKAPIRDFAGLYANMRNNNFFT